MLPVNSVHHAEPGKSRNIPVPLPYYWKRREARIVKILLFFILLVLCWPLAILVLLLYPLIWLVLLPFRILGFAVGGVLEFIRALFLLPARVLGGGR